MESLLWENSASAKLLIAIAFALVAGALAAAVWVAGCWVTRPRGLCPACRVPVPHHRQVHDVRMPLFHWLCRTCHLRVFGSADTGHRRRRDDL